MRHRPRGELVDRKVAFGRDLLEKKDLRVAHAGALFDQPRRPGQGRDQTPHGLERLRAIFGERDGLTQ